MADNQIVQLNLDQLSFIEQQDDWNKLALPKGHRQIVQAMVETHSMGSKGYGLDDSTDRLEMDLVRGKGIQFTITARNLQRSDR